jgi:hypothetical protein
MRALFALSLVALLVGGSFASACGGGGGSTPAPSSPFFGSYRSFMFTITDGPPVGCESTWGTVTANGEGAMIGSMFGNIDGSLAAPVPMDGWTTRVEPDNSFAWQISSVPAVDVFAGGIRPDGSAGVLGTVEPGVRPGILVVSRVEGVYGLPLLNDDYHACGFTYDAATFTTVSYFGRMTFDGAGGGERLLGRNANGTIGVALAPVALSYTVSLEGLVTIDATGLGHLRGGVFAGGDLVLVGGSTTDTERPVTFAMVQPSTAASLATFAGTYAIAGLQYSITSGGYQSVTGTGAADGVGALTVTFTENTEGTVVTQPPESVTYSVASDGRLTVTTGGGPLRGGVSPTGAYAVLAGPTVHGPTTGYYVLVRQ